MSKSRKVSNVSPGESLLHEDTRYEILEVTPTVGSDGTLQTVALKIRCPDLEERVAYFSPTAIVRTTR